MKKLIVVLLVLSAFVSGYLTSEALNQKLAVCIDTQGPDGIVELAPFEVTQGTRLSDGATITLPVPFEVVKETSKESQVACPSKE